MITGAYVQTTGFMTVTQTTNNLSAPGVIVSQDGYFCVERILAGIKSQPAALYNVDIMIRFESSNRDYSNEPIALSMFQGKGLFNANGKPLVIVPPHENINIIVYNRSNSDLDIFLFMEGYYVDDNGLRDSGNQPFNKALVNSIL